jgi:hypothetical protein
MSTIIKLLLFVFIILLGCLGGVTCTGDGCDGCPPGWKNSCETKGNKITCICSVPEE